MNVNSTTYWNERFKKGGSWEKMGGERQSSYFGELILTHTPKEILKDINSLKTLADIGTGLGQIAKILNDEFKSIKTLAYDFSSVAITRCKEKYSKDNIEFICGGLNKEVDVSILSNILEHVENPMDMLREHIDKTNKYIIVLCPYKENPTKLITEHVVSIDENILINEFENAKKVFEKIIDTRGSGNWQGDMVLSIYKKNEIVKDEVVKDEVVEDEVVEVKKDTEIASNKETNNTNSKKTTKKAKTGKKSSKKTSKK